MLRKETFDKEPSMSELEKLLDAGEAVKYLAEKWGIPSYRVEAFKMLRRRLGIEPDYAAGNNTLWKRSTLDKFAKPQRGRRRESGEGEEGEEGSSSSVILIKSYRELAGVS
jgi:hypothetical protein